jgi:hypothetical protein
VQPPAPRGCNLQQKGVQPPAPNPSAYLSHQPNTTPPVDKSAGKAKPAAAVPVVYEPSPEVRHWAAKAGYGQYLDAHLAYFRDYLTNRGGKPYKDLDAAFRNCIRGDWGKVRENMQKTARFGTPVASAGGAVGNRPCSYCPQPATAAVGGIPHCTNHFDYARERRKPSNPEGGDARLH